MKKGIFLSFGILAFLLISSTGTFAAKLEGINFYQEGDISILELSMDNDNVELKKFNVATDKQIILDLKGTESTDRIMRAFDTSEFSGSVVFVNAYPKASEEGTLRVAVQLRENVRSAIERKGNKIYLKMENRFGVFSQAEIESTRSYEEKINDKNLGKVHIPKSDSVEDILANLTLSGRKKYIGKKITINVRDMPVSDILKMIADASGFNIIIINDVAKLPPLTLNLTNVPWDQALDTILGLNRLVAKKNGVILMVTTLQKATDEKKLEIEAKTLVKNEEPLVTKIYPISYASIDDLKTIVDPYLTKERGSISLDSRTNSLIVKDTVDVIERIRKIVETLDTQTPQVLIESKIVEVRESYSKEIGLQNGFNFSYDPIGAIGTGGTAVGGVGTAGDGLFQAGPGFAFNSATSPGADNALFGVTVGKFNRFFDVNFALALMEQESKGKVISSPKVITQNKKKASIEASDTTSFAVVTGIGDAATTSFEETEAKLSLQVTPQVTAEGSISLEIALSKEAFGDVPAPNAPPNKAARTVNTNVLVDNGSTIVIGGIYNYAKTESHAGVPFLKDLPLIGWLFRSPYNPNTTKNELIIFLTPRIINQEEAGIASGRM